MSLIEEALRRLQDPLISKTQTSSSVQHPAPAQSHKEPAVPAHSWPISATPASPLPSPLRASPAMNLVTLAVIVMAACLIGGGVWWLGRTGSASSPIGAPTVRQAAAGPARSSQPQGSAPSVSQSSFILSGIVEGLGEPYAVINGMILTVGDQLADATLLEIGKGIVRLRLADGSETILRVPR